jgi:small subunit ribosomal protein S1
MAQRQMREQVLDELEEGQVRTGIVRNLVDFGAFVDLGGIDGLVHISELDWKHVNHPSEVLQVGDEVEVHVLGVEKERERISLSRKKLLPDPWERVTQTLQEGEFVEGKVTDVVDFGAFVDIGEGVEGLVHTSEMPPGVKHTDLESGTPVTVRVLSVDEWRRRISLRLTAIHAKEEDLPEEIAAQRIPAEEEAAEAVEAQQLHTEEEIPEEITAQEQEAATEEDVSEEPVAQEAATEEDVSEEPAAQETAMEEDAKGIDAQELHTEEEIPEELAAQEASESPAQADEEQLAQQAT